MSAWNRWALESESSPDRWAYLYRLQHRRAEAFLESLGEQLLENDKLRARNQALENRVMELRRENSELSEALEEVETQLEELEAGPVVVAAC